MPNERQEYTIVVIETGDASVIEGAHLMTDRCNMHISEIGKLLKRALLAAGYHPDSVKELFNEGDEE